MCAMRRKEKLVEKVVTYTFSEDGQTCIVENVPALVNIETGKQFISKQTKERISKIIREDNKPTRTTQVPVYNYYEGISIMTEKSLNREDANYYNDPVLKKFRHLLVDEENKIALIWSPKAGCTFAIKWFFAQCGLLDEALRFHDFIHRYRNDAYQRSERHRDSLKAFLKKPHKFEVIKVVRHPLKRAISSFVYAQRNLLAENTIRLGISDAIGRKITQQGWFSFREFVSYLETLDIYNCEVHFQAQVKPYELNERIKIDRIIDLDHAIEDLGKLEKELGLKETELAQFNTSWHHTVRKDIKGFYGDKVEFFGGEGVAIPQTKNFYDEDLVKRVGTIYAEDFKRYGYICSLDEL